mmetsp:Transcript_7992/g.11327  ORF Transcript_7992/g.11327 Transcript_7992/m.11327 type:complete len:226 (+) Transcript_7992:205-882(+)
MRVLVPLVMVVGCFGQGVTYTTASQRFDTVSRPTADSSNGISLTLEKAGGYHKSPGNGGGTREGGDPINSLSVHSLSEKPETKGGNRRRQHKSFSGPKAVTEPKDIGLPDLNPDELRDPKVGHKQVIPRQDSDSKRISQTVSFTPSKKDSSGKYQKKFRRNWTRAALLIILVAAVAWAAVCELRSIFDIYRRRRQAEEQPAINLRRPPMRASTRSIRPKYGSVNA